MPLIQTGMLTTPWCVVCEECNEKAMLKGDSRMKAVKSAMKKGFQHFHHRRLDVWLCEHHAVERRTAMTIAHAALMEIGAGN